MEKIFHFRKGLRIFNYFPDALKILGSKGYHLMEMTKLHYNVPPGFIISSGYSTGKFDLSIHDIISAFNELNGFLGKGEVFGLTYKVSVRSGSAISMPGMMDTILDVTSGQSFYDALEQVKASWNSERCKVFREMYNIPDDLGTAIIVQKMVYGDKDDESGTGVCFTRNPNTGENVLYGEYLQKARGEDIVSGKRNCSKIEVNGPTPKGMSSDNWQRLLRYALSLETDFKDMQEFEFTIESGKFFILQTRPGKRSSLAALRIATEMESAGYLTKHAATELLQKYCNLDSNVEYQIKESMRYGHRLMATGKAASPGVAIGYPRFSSDEVLNSNEDTILIRQETLTEDVKAMSKSKGVLTAVGGTTSHAATVARYMKKPCIVGCADLEFVGDEVYLNGELLRRDRKITVDGNLGHVYSGEMPLELTPASHYLKIVKDWQKVFTI